MSRRAATALRLCAAFACASLAFAASEARAPASCAAVTQGPATYSGIVNTYYPGTSALASAGSTSIGVGAIDARGALTPVASGDLLLIVQVQDAAIDSSNTATYGGSGGGRGYTSLNSSGLYEFAVAAGAGGAGAVPLRHPLLK